ncbi:MAG TPA: hypothetical protein VF961_01480, partial [Pyrinomonadaceae bacterium]
MLFVANSVVIGNGDYTDEVRNCTAGATGTAGVPPAMSAQREQLEHSTLSADVADAGETPRGP